MSPAVAAAVLALAVALGGLAAFSGEAGRRAMPVLRAFAIVAAAAVALVHLLPEAIEAAGFKTLLAAALGAGLPALLERVTHPRDDPAHEAPATTLALGYAAVVVHQAGEGAALASLARTGALSLSIVLAIAAHTVPLAMVVAVRVLEVRRARGGEGTHATAVALVGIALAMAVGAAAGSLVEASRLQRMQPWILAAAAGLLLHALGHDAFERASGGIGPRVRDGAAAFAGLAIAVVGLEGDAWNGGEATWLRAFAVGVLVVGIVAKIALPRRGAEPGAHHHGPGHRH